MAQSTPPDPSGDTKRYKIYKLVDNVHLQFVAEMDGTDGAHAHTELVKAAPEYAGVPMVPVHESFVKPAIINPRTVYDLVPVGGDAESAAQPAPAAASSDALLVTLAPEEKPKLTRREIAQKAADTRRANAARKAAEAQKTAGASAPRTPAPARRTTRTSSRSAAAKKAAATRKRNAAEKKSQAPTTPPSDTRAIAPPSGTPASVPPPPPPPPPAPSRPDNPFAE